jgi:methylamine--corrinoid protein Co-methyltransferase
MVSVQSVTEMLARIKEGESCTEKEWDTKVIPRTVKKILKKYDLMKTCNPDLPVNQDPELADRFFQAGLDLAEEIGILCTDTETVIHFSKEELLSALAQAPSSLNLGWGQDQVVLKARTPEDKTKPLYSTSLAIQIDEEIYTELVSELIRYKGIDMLCGPSIDTVFNLPVYSGTPFETAAGIREVQLREESVWRAGRPGIPQMGTCSAVTEFGYMCGYGLMHKDHNPRMGFALEPSELKTNYSTFNKVLTTAAYGGFVRTGCPSMIGGYSGSPEGATIANIATDILQFALFGGDVSASSMFDMRQNTVCSRNGLWALSMSVQATSRNTHTILDKIINQSAGPCTEEILYANTAGLVTACVSGMELTTGPRSAGGALKNYLTPLEAYFCADVWHAAAELSLGQAVEIVNYCLSKYEATITNQPIGKSYYECYDRKTRKPISEWTDIEQKIRLDLRNRGLAI